MNGMRMRSIYVCMCVYSMYIYIYTNGKIAILISHRRLGTLLTLTTLLT